MLFSLNVKTPSFDMISFNTLSTIPFPITYAKNMLEIDMYISSIINCPIILYLFTPIESNIPNFVYSFSYP